MRRVFAVLAAMALSTMLAGCLARCDISYRQHEMEYMETAIASVTCNNTGYYLFWVWPICSGEPWQEGLLKDWKPERDWFDDHVTLDANMDMIRLAAREAGCNRLTQVRTEVAENSVWSFFLIKRKSITTTARILKNKTER